MTDDAVLLRVLQLGRGRDAEDERQVRDLEPALREERGERRLGRAADADEDEIGLLEVARLLAVVALHRELDRLDAPEVLVGEREHPAGGVDGLPVEEGRQLADEGADQVERLDLQLVAGGVDVLAELGAHDGEDDEGLLVRGALEDGADGLLRADARVDADVRARVRELQHRRADNLLCGLARRVAQDVDALRIQDDHGIVLVHTQA